MLKLSPKYLIVALLFFLLHPVYAAGDGAILSLTANDGEIITINISVQANGRINNSNLTFNVISQDGVIVDAHRYSVSRMESGDTLIYSWTSDGSAYPNLGAYTLQACWSTGQSQNCNIAVASTIFYTADSLGPMLYIGLALIGAIVFRVHRVEVVDE